jgi:hypothetical protein
MAKGQFTKSQRDYGNRSKEQYQQDLINASLAAKDRIRTSKGKISWVEIANEFNVSPESLRKRTTDPKVQLYTMADPMSCPSTPRRRLLKWCKPLVRSTSP